MFFHATCAAGHTLLADWISAVGSYTRRHLVGHPVAADSAAGREEGPRPALGSDSCPLDLVRAFEISCYYGHPVCVSWLWDSFPALHQIHRDRAIQILRFISMMCVWQTFGSGVRQVAGMLRSFYAISFQDLPRADIDDICRAACYRFSDVEPLAWLHDQVLLSRDRVIIDWFGLTLRRGHVEQAQWLCQTFALTEPEMRPFLRADFRYACSKGDLRVARWLHETFPFPRLVIYDVLQDLATRIETTQPDLVEKWLQTLLENIPNP